MSVVQRFLSYALCDACRKKLIYKCNPNYWERIG